MGGNISGENFPVGLMGGDFAGGNFRRTLKNNRFLFEVNLFKNFGVFQKTYPEQCQTTKMEFFAEIFNS